MHLHEKILDGTYLHDINLACLFVLLPSPFHESHACMIAMCL